jgi:membrane-associated phospholipid phosphatase
MLKKNICTYALLFLLRTISFAQIDSANNNPKFLKALLPSGILIGIGAHGEIRALSHDYFVDANNKLVYTKNKWNERSAIFPTKIHVEDALWAAPVSAYFLGNVIGLKPQHGFKNRLILAASAYLLSNAISVPLKNRIKEPRPSDPNALVAWPSGHTANAFTGATLLHLEYGKKHPWISVSAFALASMVGTLRILNNKHALNDVVAGAGIGIFSSSLVYYINDKIKKHKH